jgi:hypothetical protein
MVLLADLCLAEPIHHKNPVLEEGAVMGLIYFRLPQPQAFHGKQVRALVTGLQRLPVHYLNTHQT